MFNLTESAKNFWLNLGSGLWHRDAIDPGLREYCESEYGEDWYWAYHSYKIDGRFPNVLDQLKPKGNN